MIDISDLKLDKAKRTLSTVREGASDEFVRQLADVSLLLLDQALKTRGLPEAVQAEFGGELIQSLAELAELSQRNAEDIDRSLIFWPFFYIARLLLTRLSLQHAMQQTDVDLRVFFDTHRSKFVGEEKLRIDYLLNGLGRTLFENQVKQAQAELEAEVKKANASFKGEVDRAEKILQALSLVDDRAQQLSELLKDRTEKLNFIGLSQGFSKLAHETEGAIRSPLMWIRLCAGAMLIAPCAVLVLPTLQVAQDLDWWQVGAPLLAIELVLLFFFRVLLQRYQSLKTQLLQIKLRFSLCAFIEDYAEFSSRIRKSADDRTLDKFEALIFSGITPDPQNVPSQFDGVEHITNLLKAVRSGGK